MRKCWNHYQHLRNRTIVHAAGESRPRRRLVAAVSLGVSVLIVASRVGGVSAGAAAAGLAAAATGNGDGEAGILGRSQGRACQKNNDGLQVIHDSLQELRPIRMRNLSGLPKGALRRSLLSLCRETPGVDHGRRFASR